MHSEKHIVLEHCESVQSIGSFQFSLPVSGTKTKMASTLPQAVQQSSEFQHNKQDPAETPKPSLGFPPADHQGQTDASLAGSGAES